MKKNILFVVLCCVCALTNLSLVRAESFPNLFEVKYDFASVLSGQGGRVDPTAPPQVEHLIFSPFHVVSQSDVYQLSEHSSAKAQFSFSGWPTNGNDIISSIEYHSALSLLDKSQYYEFIISAQDAYAFKIDNITFKLGRTATGPRLFAISSSYDNHQTLLPLSYTGASENVSVLGADLFLWADESTSLANHQVNIAQQFNNECSIRFYAFAAEDSKGKFSIDNVEVCGSVFEYIPEEDTVLGKDTIQMSQNPTDLPISVDTSQLIFHFDQTQIHQYLLMKRPYVDAVVNLYNPSDQSLYINQVEIQVLDNQGVECSQNFDVQVIYQHEVLSNSESPLYVHLEPLYQLIGPETQEYILQGTFYSNYESTEVQTNVLYPLHFSFNACAFPQVAYILQESNKKMFMRCFNDALCPSLPISIFTKSSFNKDSIYVNSLRTNEYVEYVYTLADDQSLDSVSFEFSDAYAPEISYHHLMKEIDLHKLTRKISNEDSSDYYCFTKDGRCILLEEPDTLVLDAWLNDTLLQLSVDFSKDHWTLLTSTFKTSPDSMSLQKVIREDGSEISPAYFGSFKDAFFVMDTLAKAGDFYYHLYFVNHYESLDPVYVNLYDSICLGDSYQENGFDLPGQFEAGDFLFTDTLLAVNGADSIVSLYLNVCAQPENPGEILGDSIIVKAGNYVYTIKPVPSAAFYVWTVLPNDWMFESDANRMTLTIPYPGTGAISVKAVNRCGSSSESYLNLSTNGLTDVQSVNFSVYPGENENSFVLYTQGLVGQTTVMVYDMSGKVLYQESRDLMANDENFQISLSEYAGGMYMIGIINQAYSSSAVVQLE